MESIKIGGNIDKYEVRKIADGYFSNSKVKIEDIDFKGRYEISFSLKEEDVLGRVAFINTVGNIAYDSIIDIYVPDYIKKKVIELVKKDNLNFTMEEIDQVTNISYREIISINSMVNEKSESYLDIIKTIEEMGSISLDGYMYFRMKDFLIVIDTIAQITIEDYLDDKKNREFIDMIKYLIDVQSPKYHMINLIIGENSYYILDENKKPISDDIVDDIKKEFNGEKISKLDILISSLIVIAPREIRIHKMGNVDKEILNFIDMILEGKVSYCKGCDYCKNTGQK